MRRLLVLVGGLLMMAGPIAPAFAHHGWSSYDATQVLEVKAPLSDVTWGNPHGAAKVTWQGATWDVILAPTSRMEARGLSLDMIDKGQTITIIGYPRLDGTKEMRIERVIVDGKTVELR